MCRRFKQHGAGEPDDPYVLERLDFLMRYLGWHLGTGLDATVHGLNANLGYRIPLTVPDPEDRLWRDPVQPCLRTVIHAAPLDTRRTTGFTLRGTGALAGLAIHSCGTNAVGTLCWTTAFHFSRDTAVAAASFRIVEALWSHPRWTRHDSFDFCWLEPSRTPPV